jgi:hypothetical protein
MVAKACRQGRAQFDARGDDSPKKLDVTDNMGHDLHFRDSNARNQRGSDELLLDNKLSAGRHGIAYLSLYAVLNAWYCGNAQEYLRSRLKSASRRQSQIAPRVEA